MADKEKVLRVFGQRSTGLSPQMSRLLGELHKDTREMRQSARRVKRASGEPDEDERALGRFMLDGKRADRRRENGCKPISLELRGLL
jgi:hypothetical protein